MRTYPHRVAKIMSWFIPSRKNRHHFLEKHDRKMILQGFDAEYYLTKYPDIKQAGIDPREHYIKYGRFEGRFKNERGIGNITCKLGNTEKDLFATFYRCVNFILDQRGLGVDIKKKRDKRVSLLSGYASIFEYVDEHFISIENEEFMISKLEQNADLLLLISHEFSLTGAPIATQRFAKVLLEQGKCPLIVSPCNGKLKDELIKDEIPCMVCEGKQLYDFVERNCNSFSFILVNTAVLAPVIHVLNRTNIPVMWWIHECYALYTTGFIDMLPKKIKGNIHICCVGDRAMNALTTVRPLYKTVQLLYTIPDLSKKTLDSFTIRSKNNRKVFVLVGTMEQRKGQDILCDAILKLPRKYIESSLFYIVSHHIISYCDDILEKVINLRDKYQESVVYIDSMLPYNLYGLYQQMDCLICPSRDDPMPIVVTEAFSLSKLVICSDNIGQSKFIRELKGGLVFTNNSSEELCNMIKRVVDEEDESLCSLRMNGRLIYERYFSKEVFSKEVDKILNFKE